MWYGGVMDREDAVAKLRQHEADLKKMGVKSLYLFAAVLILT